MDFSFSSLQISDHIEHCCVAKISSFSGHKSIDFSIWGTYARTPIMGKIDLDVHANKLQTQMRSIIETFVKSYTHFQECLAITPILWKLLRVWIEDSRDVSRLTKILGERNQAPFATLSMADRKHTSSSLKTIENMVFVYFSGPVGCRRWRL